ncbi:unnamed protein product [Parascedosporium putredinis]|uniref:Uncharacterized protein n=1 Tax=Parascedosporium putredinis TaxID=1442378 RepID=A0A9P1H3X3_9PEZI|nr:unnamed protein product [Parascedosporium putredinis]CAI7995112.1 unnamed protein product [Parascedosporium putredinis]
MSAASPSAQKAPSTEPTVPLSEKQAARPSFSVPDAVDYPPAPSETNRYRILVHDPATGTISTADATSVAADHNEVLTPSQIMPRLANPAKFLPHFDVLQSQGYEAVSGSGDVLVFRKVREPTEPGTVFLRRTAAGSASASAHLAGSGTASQAPAINPIDMMGSESVTPAIGNFTSPTGYVSYDHDLSFGGGESGFVVKPPPPFRKYNSIAAASDADTEYDRKDKASDKSSPYCGA